MSGMDPRMGVLCLGASAGGLRSVEAVLANLPASFPWPILVSQHLQREHVSLMPEILSRATKLQVREAMDGEIPVAGVVYTCPSAAELGISPEGRLSLRPLAEGRPQRIDHLFSTASFAKPGLVIAVILSGTGNDGTAGSLVVKLNGGTVIAESEESAEHSAMPRAAVKAGTVDAMRSAEAIAPLVIELAEGGLEEMTQALSRDVAAIAQTLAASSGTDFSRYRSATLRRRIEKRCALVGAATASEYHEIVKRDPIERDALIKSLLLPVTEFFRDPAAWETLAAEVLPALVTRADAGGTVRVWCAGCASGEEVYSMAIALAEGGVPLDRVQIVATDLDPDSIHRAKSATYETARMENVDAARRARFFVPDGGAFRVVDELRRCVDLRVHDLTRDPPPAGPFDMIVCRNVLIYFEDTLQAQVLEALEASLVPGGILFLGRSTAIPSHADAFEPVARTMRIFRSRRTTGPGPPLGPLPASAAQPAPTSSASAAQNQVDAIVVEDPNVIILVVDDSWRITFASRRAREVTSEGVVGKDLFAVFPRWENPPVRDALRSSMSEGRSVHIQGVPMSPGFVDVALEVLSGSGARKLLLVATPVPARQAPTRTEREDQELLREDLAATNDELQTANEELAAANEELQATNEELASLNEEFLSTNQNLASTNAQMQANIHDAEPSAKLLRAILLSRGGAVVACDASRRVTIMTPRAATLLRLDATLIGRPLDARMLGIEAGALNEWLDASAQASAPIHRDVPTADGPLRVSIEGLRGPGGEKVGWLLTWTAPDEAPQASLPEG